MKIVLFWPFNSSQNIIKWKWPFCLLISFHKNCASKRWIEYILINGINDRYDKYDSYRASNVKFFFETNPTSTSLSIAFSTWPWSFTIVSTIYFCVHSGFSRISSSTSFCVAPNLDSRTSSLMLNPWPFRLRYFSHCSTSFPVTCKTQPDPSSSYNDAQQRLQSRIKYSLRPTKKRLNELKLNLR